MLQLCSLTLLVILCCLTGCASPGSRTIAPANEQIYHTENQQNAAYVHRNAIDDDPEDDRTNPVLDVLEFPVVLVVDMVKFPIQQMQSIGDRSPGIAARMTLDTASADRRREGLARLVEFKFAHRPPYTTRYEDMARTDPDVSVRAAALRACNRARDRRATSLFITALADDSPTALKLEAAKGLANVPDPNAAAPLLKIVSNPDEDRDVRIAAADALKYYRTIEVGRALSTLLSEHDFGVSWQARRSLVFLTRKDFGYDQSAWLSYLAGPQRPLG